MVTTCSTPTVAMGWSVSYSKVVREDEEALKAFKHDMDHDPDTWRSTVHGCQAIRNKYVKQEVIKDYKKEEVGESLIPLTEHQFFVYNKMWNNWTKRQSSQKFAELHVSQNGKYDEDGESKVGQKDFTRHKVLSSHEDSTNIVKTSDSSAIEFCFGLASVKRV